VGLLSPFRAARRRRILERSPIEEGLWSWALKEHRVFRWLSPADAARLRELATVFLAEKTFDPVGGVVLDDRILVSIAAQACLPLLGLDLDWYSDWSTIIVTPREYGVSKRDVDEAGVVHEYDDEFAGEAFDLGPVALSRVDVEASGWGDGYNVVIHEMAHKLDGRDGAFDGCPPLHRGMDYAAWRQAFQAAFDDLRDRGGRGSTHTARSRRTSSSPSPASTSTRSPSSSSPSTPRSSPSSRCSSGAIQASGREARIGDPSIAGIERPPPPG
jgi:Mlc titration factor MtfA (ptsG expression regulator)